jgi:hypothetical protein
MISWLFNYEFDTKSAIAKSIGKIFLIIFAFYILVVANVLMFIWSDEPDTFNVQQVTAEFNEKYGLETVAGSHTMATTIHMSDVLLNKTGGYLSNDVTYPSIFMDNIPRWEFGVVEIQRVMALSLRKDLSRSQSQSQENKDLINAQTAYNNDHAKWLFPNAESKFKEATDSMISFTKDMADSNKSEAQFYTRADNLRDLLEELSKKLGSLSQGLSEASPNVRVNTDLANDNTAEQSTVTSKYVSVKTKWNKIDDVFYESRGQSWAMLHVLKAVKYDFEAVLTKKNAHASLDQIIKELEDTQQPVGSLIILNGEGFGHIPNHSFIMANYISRANAAIIDLIDLLNRG